MSTISEVRGYGGPRRSINGAALLAAANKKKHPVAAASRRPSSITTPSVLVFLAMPSAPFDNSVVYRVFSTSLLVTFFRRNIASVGHIGNSLN